LKNLLNYLAELIGETITNYKPISGGDISNVFLLETKQNHFFLKVNSQKEAYTMFLAEKQGLEAIAQTHTIATPKVHYCGQYESDAFLLLKYIEPKTPSSKDFESLANQLAGLHKITASKFGWSQDNFIGSLSQTNQQHQNWATFYLNERISPQLELAKSKYLLSTNDIPEKQKIYSVFQELFQGITPSLLHGDLWSGNYLIAMDGTPYLIDPAVYYGHNEVDIAMSKLFGGFAPSFYQTYQEHFPSSEQTNARMDLYQLYYLLVHLNLFGRSYYDSVKRILTHYF
jgi:fructosamine-3-kinase